MNFDLIVCRSLTYAQRTSVVLEREGISNHVLRTPAHLSDKGCGYAVKISHKRLTGCAFSVKWGRSDPESCIDCLR